MASFHPPLDWLQRFSAGHMHHASALAVATHLSFCAQCRSRVAQLNEIGGTLLEDLNPVPLTTDAFVRLQSKLSSAAQDSLSKPALAHSPSGWPKPLHALMQQREPQYTRIGWSLKQATLKEMNDGTIVALHHISAGGKTPQHTHEGDEITVVLRGSFSDELGLYQPGDFILANETTDHRPTASKHSDCLCFTVQHAPLKLTGPVGRWLNPLLRLTSR